jgi:predicted metal-dependent phosphoesterase TrpH
VGAPTFDLQSHSTCSDGALAPADVVAAAAEAGVQLLALTDHDTVDGVDEALEAGAAHGLRVVAAIELSALDDDREDLHLLGYRLDHRSPRLLEALAELRADRAARGRRMADALRACGLELEVPERASLGRPHLAQAAFDHPSNRMRLAREEVVNASQLLEAYLIPGAPAYRRRTKPTVAEAIALVHEAGGVAVWAHPFWDVDASEAVIEAIDRFAALGLDGVEAFYPTHGAEQARLIAARCAERDLLTTGSADFHGPAHPIFARFRAFELHGLEPRLGPIAAPAPV